MPGANVVTNPVASGIAFVESLLAHVTGTQPLICPAPPSRGVAVNCTVCPAFTELVAGVA